MRQGNFLSISNYFSISNNTPASLLIHFFQTRTIAQPTCNVNQGRSSTKFIELPLLSKTLESLQLAATSNHFTVRHSFAIHPSIHPWPIQPFFPAPTTKIDARHLMMMEMMVMLVALALTGRDDDESVLQFYRQSQANTIWVSTRNVCILDLSQWTFSSFQFFYILFAITTTTVRFFIFSDDERGDDKRF